MGIFKLIPVLLLFSSNVFAAPQQTGGINNEALATQSSTALAPTIFATDRFGQLMCTAGTSATSLGKAEDVAHASGDTGVASWTVRRDAPSSTAVSTGNYAAFTTDSLGKLWTAESQIEDAAHTTADIGAFVLSVRTDVAATSANTTGDYATVTSDAVGALYVHEIGGTANGATLVSVISAATNNSTVTKASAGQIYTISACNSNAAIRYVKFYNKASAPTCGTDTPVLRILVPASNCSPAIIVPPGGLFATGIGFCMVTGVTDADNTSVAASDILLNFAYK